MSPASLGFILSSVCFAVLGQVCFKTAANRREHGGPLWRRWWPSRRPLLLGLLAYGCSMLLWLKALSRVELSTAFPYLSLNFVGILLAARFHLRERLAGSRLLGAGLILLGVLLVTLSA
jgi:undecaprenyl phosphate-alpha-L-ara4N flippase subunit ArnE